MSDPLPYNNLSDSPKNKDFYNRVIDRHAIYKAKDLNPLYVHWGPSQFPMFKVTDEYLPPGHWPASSQILKIPVVIRFFSEDPTIHVDFDIWQGYSGGYDYGTHFKYYDYDLVNDDSSYYPSHIHFSHIPFPDFSDGTFVSYAIEGVISHYLGGTEGWHASGSSNDWQVPVKLNLAGPLFWIDLVQTDGIARKAVELAAALWIGPSPVRHHPDQFLGLGTRVHYTGLDNVGIGKPIFLGTYSIDDVPFGNSISFPYALTIDIGYDEPPPVDIKNHKTNIDTIGSNLRGFYNSDLSPVTIDSIGNQIIQFPWFDKFDFPIGNLDCWSCLLPTNTDFFGTAVLHILILSAPRDMPGENFFTKIVEHYPKYAGFKVEIYTDTKYMKQCGLDKVGAIASFLDELAGLVQRLSQYGFHINPSEDFDWEDIVNTQNRIKVKIDNFAHDFPKKDGGRTMLREIIDKQGITHPTVGDEAPLDGKVIVPGSDHT